MLDAVRATPRELAMAPPRSWCSRTLDGDDNRRLVQEYLAAHGRRRAARRARRGA